MDLFEHSPALPFELPSGNGYSVMRLERAGGYGIKIPHGELIYVDNFFDKKISDRCVAYFQENENLDWKEIPWTNLSPEEIGEIKFRNVNWKQDYISLYGKKIPLPRLTAWYGDGGKAYTYSGITSTPNPWNKGLLHLKQEIEEFSGCSFNSVLLNWYRDGNDHLSWHADDEKELGENPTIASANFGETRDFVVRSNEDNSKKILFHLKHGTLLIMKGAMQHYWQHSVPKRKKAKKSRFNLTFRHIQSA